MEGKSILSLDEKKIRELRRGRAYGRKHRKRRKALLYNLNEGVDRCDVCGRLMYKDPKLNFDGKPLNADHEVPLSKLDYAGHLASRLLHDTCNKSIGDRWEEIVKSRNENKDMLSKYENDKEDRQDEIKLEPVDESLSQEIFKW